jgi:hypothetical protein
MNDVLGESHVSSFQGNAADTWEFSSQQGTQEFRDATAATWSPCKIGPNAFVSDATDF